jgi:hypothetical protein
LVELLTGVNHAYHAHRKIMDSAHSGMAALARNVQDIAFLRVGTFAEEILSRRVVVGARRWLPAAARIPLRTGGMPKPIGVKHPQLRKYVDALWKPHTKPGEMIVGNGGAIDAAWWTRVTRRRVGDSTHFQKVADIRQGLLKNLANGQFTGRDAQIARALADDIERAALGDPARLFGAQWAPKAAGWQRSRLPWLDPTLPSPLNFSRQAGSAWRVRPAASAAQGGVRMAENEQAARER